jgi:hypothetical protein
MKKSRTPLVWLISAILLFQNQQVFASASELVVAQEYQGTYSRSAFKHWIDADKDGCNTRAEVLIEEATVKPKIGKKCVLSGGRWLSPYDNKVTTKFSDLDIDHLVPLAEAWRSGAWAWTPAQREAYANDLTESRALVAVSLGLNRSKGDKDVAKWLPKVNTCQYFESWIIVKKKYALTIDSVEAARINTAIQECDFDFPKISLSTSPSIQPPTSSPTPSPTIQNEFKVQLLTDSSMGAPNTFFSCVFNQKRENMSFDIYFGITEAPNTDNFFLRLGLGGKAPSGLEINKTDFPNGFSEGLLNLTPTQKLAAEGRWVTCVVYDYVGTLPHKIFGISSLYVPKDSLAPTPTASTIPTVSPGAFCSPAGATGKSSSGVLYACKTSPTDTRNRWRQ